MGGSGLRAQSPSTTQQGGTKAPNASRLPPVREFEQFAPYWTDEAGWRSELQMRNNMAQGSLTITPVLRGPDGTEFPLSPVTILPNEAKTLDVADAVLNQAPQLIGSYGSVVFRYNSRSLRSLYAAVMVFDAGHPIEFHLDAFTQATDYSTGSREGIWWLPNETARDLLLRPTAASSRFP